MEAMKLDEFLTLEAVAKVFGVPKLIVSRWARELGLPVIKLDARRSLVHEATLAQWLKGRESARPAI